MASMKTMDVCVLDTETSGTEPLKHEILDFAACRFSWDMVERARVSRRCKLMRPDLASAEALKVNGYSAEEWNTAVPIRAALIEFSDLLALGGARCIVLAHNASFDIGFIREAYNRESLACPNMFVFCTMSMAWLLVMKGEVEKVKLDVVCDYYGVSNEGGHRALVDVKRTARVYSQIAGLRTPKFLDEG